MKGEARIRLSPYGARRISGPGQAVAADAAPGADGWREVVVPVEGLDNAAAQFLSGMHVKLNDGKTTVAEFTCWAPWVLFKAPAGNSYKLTASLAGRPDSPVKSANFTVPSSGQKRVDIAFPEIKANE